MATPQTFLSNHFPEARASLRPGATEEQISNFELHMNVKLPPALRIIYK